MKKFCGYCGTPIDEKTGQCPKCSQSQQSNAFVPTTKVDQNPPERGKNKKTPKPLSKLLAIFQKRKANRADNPPKTKKQIVLRAVALILVVVVLISTLLLCLLYKPSEEEETASEFQQLMGKFTDIQIIDAESAIEAAQDGAKQLGLQNAADELSLKNQNTVNGLTYYRLQQNYEGIPVYGRTFCVIADQSGTAQGITANGLDLKNVNVSQSISMSECKKIIVQYLNNEYSIQESSIVVEENYTSIIYSLNEQEAVFAYKFDVETSNDSYIIIVSVRDKKIIECVTSSMTSIIEATGNNMNSKEVSFDAMQLSESLYALEDIERNLRVYDANKAKKILIDSSVYVVVDEQGKEYSWKDDQLVDSNNNPVNVIIDDTMQGTWIVTDEYGRVIGKNARCILLLSGDKATNKLSVVTSNSPNFDNPQAVTVLTGSQTSYDFFKDLFGRIGFDNQNGSLSLVCNVNGGAYSSGLAQSNPFGMLVFGNSSSLEILELGLVAHEYTHSVEQSISGMVYKGESGAIMEAYSDLFGELVEDYSKGTLDGDCDWRFQAKFEGTYNHSRDLKNPHDTGNPVRVGERTSNQVKFDEKHHYSTVVSHAAYLMTTLSGNTISNLTMEELAQLWYQTMLTLPSNCSFIVLRRHMEMTAKMMGLTAQKQECVSAAFEQVGIVYDSEEGTYGKDLKISVYDQGLNPYDAYTISITGQEKVLWWTESYSKTVEATSKGAQAITLPKGTYTIRVTDKNNKDCFYEKTITVDTKSKKYQLNFYTAFGEMQESEQTQGNFSLSDLPNQVVEWGGHYYYAFTESGWNAAKNWCEAQNGYLASITSSDENEFLRSYIFDTKELSFAYFGLTDEAVEGTWKWVNGETLTYTNWHTGEPNATAEDYGLFSYSDGTWNNGDLNEGGEIWFICEWGEYRSEDGEPEKKPTTDGRDVVLVLDVSGSMNGTPIEETKKAASQFIDTVFEQSARVGIVTFASSAKKVSDLSTDVDSLKNLVNNLNATGGTNIDVGLQMAEAMLAESTAKQKIIVLMSDGEPGGGRTGEDLIAYADTIKAKEIDIYTLGFFEKLMNKSAAQQLMEGIASEGLHYEVSDAESLVFFFDDMADQINGQKYIYVRIACPVDVLVTYNGQTLSSAAETRNTRTDFGTLTFEDNPNATSAADGTIKILRLKEENAYDLKIVGLAEGTMDYTIGFMDENGEYSDLRSVEDIPITATTRIDTTAKLATTLVLSLDADGDGKYDSYYKLTGASGEETKSNRRQAPAEQPNRMIYVWMFIGIASALGIGLAVFFTVRHYKKRSNQASI